MNSDFPPNERTKLETNLTALLLGELPADEIAKLSKAMEQDPELAALYEQLKFTIELVREGTHPAAQKKGESPLKLSDARREKLLASFKTIVPQEFAKPRRHVSSLVQLAAVLVIVGVLGSLLLPPLAKSKSRARRVSQLQDSDQFERIADHEPQISTSVSTTMPAPPPVEIVLPGRSTDVAQNGWGDNDVALSYDRAVGVGAGPSQQVLKGRVQGQTSYVFAAASDLSDSANKLRDQQSVLTTRLNQSGDSGDGGFIGGTSFAFDAGTMAVTNGIVAGVVIDRDSYNLNVTADSRGAETLADVVAKLDQASVPGRSNGVPILKDVPGVGHLFRNASTTIANDNFQTAATLDDVSGLHYLATNAVVVSQPIVSHDSWQVESIDGAINSYSYNAAVTQSLKGDGDTTSEKLLEKFLSNNMPLASNVGAVHSSGIAKGDGPKSLSFTDRLLTTGLRAGAMSETAAAGPIGLSGGGGGGGSGRGGAVLTPTNARNTGLNKRIADAALPKPTVSLPTPQPEILTRENAFSTFSLNVSDVSFKLAAASLEKGQMPEPASIRSEEFINAFNYRDPDALPGVPIAFASERARYPFAQNRELLRFSLKTAAAGRQAGRPLNIVLLLDNSGSMERADRVEIIREALRVLAGQLQASDSFSVVTFARTAQLRVDGIPGNQAAAAAEEIAKLTPEGGTNLGDALDAAYETALHHYLANGDNRVVLLTDGAANLGDVNADVLKRKVEAHRRQGVALDCFGIGWEGYNDDLLEVLTRNGDGRYGFINTPGEANTEFVAQIAGALHVAASDVKVQVEFNPKRVTSYRQIGYARHQLTKEQFRDNTVDAAEIAAQEAGNALYTIEVNPEGEGSIATVRVRYKVPGTAEYREQAWDVPYTAGTVAMDQASPAMRLASTASAFSEWLATSPFAAEVSTDRLLNYLSGVPQVYGADTRPAKLEWMIRQARSISGK